MLNSASTVVLYLSTSNWKFIVSNYKEKDELNLGPRDKDWGLGNGGGRL